MWVYTTWPGYRYGYWFRDAKGGIRPTWLFSANGDQVSFKKFTPSDTTWPEGAIQRRTLRFAYRHTRQSVRSKRKPIEFPPRDGQAPPPTDIKLAYKDWDSELRCVVINKSSAIVANSRTICLVEVRLIIPRNPSCRVTPSSVRTAMVIGASKGRNRRSGVVGWGRLRERCVFGAIANALSERLPYRRLRLRSRATDSIG